MSELSEAIERLRDHLYTRRGDGQAGCYIDTGEGISNSLGMDVIRAWGAAARPALAATGPVFDPSNDEDATADCDRCEAPQWPSRCWNCGSTSLSSREDDSSATAAGGSMVEQDWACPAHGFDPRNHEYWCALGGGHNVNMMIEVKEHEAKVTSLPPECPRCGCDWEDHDGRRGQCPGPPLVPGDELPDEW